MKTNPNWNDEKMKRDLLDRLVLPQSAAQSLGVTFSDEEIIGEVVGFFGAGQETSTQAMTFLVYELCENEGVQSKLVKEIDDVLGGNIPTLDILPSLKYLDAVVKETLRFHTILPQMLRVTAQEFSANSDDGSIFLFPKNSTVFIDCEAVHHSKTYWGDDVDVFKPERWLANGEEFVPVPGSFLPFGDGPMNCIGQKVALIEIKITMIRLLQEFKIRHSPKQGPVVLINTVTSGLKHGLIVEIEKK
ncbi:Cytochrome P450 3A4 [Nowakowskiella sp. JEL0407]|nr:Cytochrome P450 3A4 [Nowakowskiella sp. JEL0407]